MRGPLQEDEGKGRGPWDKVSRHCLKLAGQSQEQPLALAQVAIETIHTHTNLSIHTLVFPVLDTEATSYVYTFGAKMAKCIESKSGVR